MELKTLIGVAVAVAAAGVGFAADIAGAKGVVSAEEFLARRVCITDTVRFTAANGCVSCVDPEHAFVYSAHIASRDGHGENPHVLALARVPVAQPWRAQSWVLAERGVPLKGGKTYGILYDYFNVMHGGKVRTYCLGDADEFFYIDFDPVSEAVEPERPVLCRWGGGAAAPLTSAALGKYLSESGMGGFDLYVERSEHLISAAHPVWRDGGFYGTVTSPKSQPVVFHCKDDETFEFVGIIPAVCRYECPLAELNGVMYALLRQVEDGQPNFWTSRDRGRTWKPAGTVPHGTCRPQLLAWKGRLLIAYSQTGLEPNRVRPSRNNMIVLRGEGEDLSKYEEVFRVVDPLGFVQYDLVDYKGRLLCIWSNSELYPDKPQKWCNGLQGKDALFMSWLDGL